jgi:Zn-dependent protease with chaperone function
MPQPGEAIYFDGQSNKKRQVEIRFGGALEIVEDGRIAVTWPYGDVRRVDSAPGVLRLMCITAPGLARLEIRDTALQQAVEAHCAALDVARSRSQTLKIVVYSAAALASFIGLLIYGIPLLADRLAAVIPMSFERRLGDAVDGQVRRIISGKICDAPEGQAALKQMTGRLVQAMDIHASVDVEVLASGLSNAVTLPGGKIYVLDGLLQKTNEPDELAGVIAHELGHLHRRDGLRRLIREGGTAFLFGLLFGDVLGGGAIIYASRSLLTQSHSRDAERDADAFAIDAMRKLGRSPKAMGNLLVRIAGPNKGNGVTILSSHPLSEERLDTMTKADAPMNGAPLVSPTEWAALKAICR